MPISLCVTRNHDGRVDPALEEETFTFLPGMSEVDIDHASPRVTAIGAIPRGTGLLAGGLVSVTGWRLKFDEGNEELGLFFRSEEGEVRARVYAEIRPARIVAAIPPRLTEDDYILVVRTAPRGASILEGVSSESVHIADDAMASSEAEIQLRA